MTTTETQVQDYRKAASLLFQVAVFRSHRMTPEENKAMYATAHVLSELADSDDGRPGATR